VVLGFGRAIGETMIVLMASGNAAVIEPFNFATSVRTVTATHRRRARRGRGGRPALAGALPARGAALRGDVSCSTSSATLVIAASSAAHGGHDPMKTTRKDWVLAGLEAAARW
jgi:hypothetical protein